MEELRVSKDLSVFYEDDGHIYRTADGRELLSVTQLMKKHGLSPDYSGVSDSVLSYKAELGTIAHASFEKFIKSNGGVVEPLPALFWFRDTLYGKYDQWSSEVPILTMGFPVDYAGRIDIVAKKGDRYTIFDIKRTASVHKEALSWQLSLYRKGWCFDNNVPMETVELKCIHINETPKVIKVDPIPDTELNRLLECEAHGVPFIKAQMVTARQAKALLSFQKKVSTLKAKQKEAEQNFEKAKEEILRNMKAYGLTNFTVGTLSITRVPAYEKQTFDKEKVQKDFPDTKDEKYFKTSTVAESLRITEKKS